MRISTEIGSFRKLGDDRKTLKLLKDAGFTAYDFTMFDSKTIDELLSSEEYLEWAKVFRAYADELGLPCNQAHAPFPTAKKGDEAYNKAMFPKVVRALEVAGVLGAKVCVVHPCNDYTAEENAELYKRFEPYARKAGVKIGLENMWNCVNRGTPLFRATKAACSHHDDFRKHLDLLPADVFVACLDIGHAEMAGLDTSAVEMIYALGDRLEAMHLHDNDRVHDCHEIPFTYRIDYQPILDALRAVGYKGDITLETGTGNRTPVELYPQLTAYQAQVANYFKQQLKKE